MPKQVRVPVLMDDTLRKKAKQDSKDMFGDENVSQLVRFLLKNHKSKK